MLFSAAEAVVERHAHFGTCADALFMVVKTESLGYPDPVSRLELLTVLFVCSALFRLELGVKPEGGRGPCSGVVMYLCDDIAPGGLPFSYLLPEGDVIPPVLMAYHFVMFGHSSSQVSLPGLQFYLGIL